eukprot:186277-Amphidinium_carterae.1
MALFVWARVFCYLVPKLHAGEEHQSNLEAPLQGGQGVLLFAGEATSATRYGYLDGAAETGSSRGVSRGFSGLFFFLCSYSTSSWHYNGGCHAVCTTMVVDIEA